VAAAIRHLARWLAWQLGELERPLEHPPARITLFSSEDPPLPEDRSA
jgi:hypothetical protein